MWVSFKSIFSKDLALSSKYAGTFVLIVLKLSYNEMPAIIEALKRVFKDFVEILIYFLERYICTYTIYWLLCMKYN